SVIPSSSVLEGSSVTLICSSDANPAVLNYTWSRESEGQLEQLQTGHTLTFNRTDLKHRGWYHCTAQNKHGDQNSSVMLDIQYGPKNMSTLAIPSSSVLEGSSVTLICSSDANPAVLNYTWSRESEGQLEQLQTGDTLTFNRTDPTDRGWYHCTAQNQHGSQNSSVMLDIQYGPKNMSTLAIPSSSVLEGSSVTLICSSDANPAVLNYTWSRESEGQLKQLQTGDTLTFNRTDLKHRGWYHCTVQNKHGSQNSSVMLDIQYAPKISSSSSCYRTDVPVCFCEADGNPSPELEWHLSGRPVTNSSNTFISEERLSSTGLRSSITLHQSLTNTSTLQCVSKNTHGTARKQLQLPLSHLQFADAPKISPSSSCTRTDVTVCFCEVDGNPSPELEWHLSGRPVTNSSNTFISEERLSSTGLRSFITLHQSLTHTSALQCVSNNTHGTARKQLQLPLCHLQFADCQKATVSLLIILTLILVLYALTVGLGLYKMRQLSTKLKAQNEAADTYASLHLSAPPSEYDTLNIKRGSPHKPTVQLYVEQKEVQDQEEVLEVLEGSSVSLRCSAETLCSSPPPTLTWSSTPRIPLSESSRLQELISDLNFTATHRQHRVTFTCTITYQLQDENKTAQNNITLHVQYSPKNCLNDCVGGQFSELHLVQRQ
ncbi:B-cell receptor CD22-like, partial [Labeo rohita]|uniref:B-cell receptor CD22-like n=1 Tax=Labeo rohita TaxID=84645 RepID=UPI0021E2AB76